MRSVDAFAFEARDQPWQPDWGIPVQIDQGVISTATRRGLRPTALTDITARARSVFKLVNGAPRAFEADGQSVRYGRDGVTPMTLEEWFQSATSGKAGGLR